MPEIQATFSSGSMRREKRAVAGNSVLAALVITSLKIVGRGNTLERKIEDVTFLNTLRSYVKEKPAKKSFREKARRLYNETYHRTCRLHMCYYPSVMMD